MCVYKALDRYVYIYTYLYTYISIHTYIHMYMDNDKANVIKR